MTVPEVYNPLDKNNLGRSVAEALLEQSPSPLGDLKRFLGPGLYAIYYRGDFPCYLALASTEMGGGTGTPIYVGKAISPGARKGNVGLDAKPSDALFKRLRDHEKSIRQANNLSIDDFFCRYLVVDDIWIALGESLLIARSWPVWNTLVDGFGNHDPGSGRYDQVRSRWDVLHPGRAWAERCQERTETAEDIMRDVVGYLGMIG